MALTTPQKTTLAGMNTIDKALALMYILGVDKPTTVSLLGDACIKAAWANIVEPTNEQKALAILHTVKTQLQHVWVTQATQTAEEAARNVARDEAKRAITAAMAADLPLPDMPQKAIQQA